MSGTDRFLSESWYRIAPLRPRLRAGVRVTRQRVRGATWHVLTDGASGRSLRFNAKAYRLIGCCDGRCAIDEIWSARCAADGDAAPTQVEAIGIFSRAFGANLLVADVAPDAETLRLASGEARKRRTLAMLNPLSLRVPLWDPDAFLQRGLPWVAWLFTRRAALAAGATALLGLLVLLINAEAFGTFAAQRLASGRVLLALWLAYPLLKLVHELAHAFATRAHGGAVHQMGITLLLLTPVPYVDASSSAAFADKRERIAVAAAGILTEGVLAAAALVVWLIAENGVVRDAAFAVVCIGLVSSLLVNGNPLLKFDGYYVFTDALELPNLAARSAAYYKYLVLRFILGLRNAQVAPPARGERRWLLAYAPLAWLYRAALITLLARYAVELNPALGLLVAACGAYLLLLAPVLRASAFVANGSLAAGRRGRALGTVAAVLGVLAVALFVVPVPHATRAPGLVWLPEDSLVRAGVDGFIEEIVVRDGQQVAAGDLLMRSSNDTLDAELARIDTAARERRVEYATYLSGDPLRAALAADDMARLAAEREVVLAKMAALEVRAPVAGTIVIERAHDLVGRFAPQSRLLAHLLPGPSAGDALASGGEASIVMDGAGGGSEAPAGASSAAAGSIATAGYFAGAPTAGGYVVRAFVRNEDIALVREQRRTVAVMLAHERDELPAQWVRAVPRATRTLPSAALGEAAGGSIEVDPADAQGLTAREPRFEVDVRLDAPVDLRAGARAIVTFRHDDAPIARQFARFIRRTFLSRIET